jgi:single-stranded DNA-binding protein
MRSAQIVGRLVRDPEVARNGAAPLAIAVNEGFKDKESGEWKDRTYYITTWAYGKTGEYAANNLGKGDVVAVDARVGTMTNDKGHTDGYNFTVTNLKRVLKARGAESEASVTTDDVPF